MCNTPWRRRQGKLVTFGIVPTAPETGFGYIACGAADGHIRQVRGFVENPRWKSPRAIWPAAIIWEFRHVLLYRRRCAGGVPLYCPALFAAGEACWAASRGEG